MNQNNFGYFGQMGNDMDIEPIDLINHLKNQNLLMEEQIRKNNNLIEKLMIKINLGQNNNIINIYFTATSGLKVAVQVHKDIQINELFKTYMRKIGMEDHLFDEDIFFVRNAVKIDKNDTRRISHPAYSLANNSEIIVIDLKYKINIHH